MGGTGDAIVGNPGISKADRNFQFFQAALALLVSVGLALSAWTVTQVVEHKERITALEANANGAHELLLEFKSDFDSNAVNVAHDMRALRALLTELLLKYNGSEKGK